MKKLLALFMSISLLLVSAGCSGKDPDITGYYALTELSKDDQVVFNEEQIMEFLYPSFGYNYVDVAADGTAALNLSGYEEIYTYDWKNKTFTATGNSMIETYSFEYKNDQLILKEHSDSAYVLTFTKRERPSEEDMLPIEPGDSGYDVTTTTDPAAPGYTVYETELMKVYFPEELDTYASRDQDYELIVDGEKVVMFIQSIAIDELTDEDFDLEDIRDAIYEGNDVVENGVRYMTYTSEVDGMEYFFVYSLLNDAVNFYDVTLVCFGDAKDVYKDVMLDIISRIELKNE